MNVDLPRPTSRVLFVLAVIFVLAAAGPAGAEEICFRVSVGGTGPDLFFHLNPSVSLTSVGRIVTLAGLVRRIVGTTVTLDPVTGTAVTEDGTAGVGGLAFVMEMRVNLVRTGLTGTTIYNARLGPFFNDFPPYQQVWYGVVTVDRLPQGTTSFPQTTEQIVFSDCVTGQARAFFY